VRHPIYTGYFVAWFAYVLENPSARNGGLLALALVAQLVRIHEEERVLADEDEYRRYMTSVRRRLIPYLY
jgi:protein-S-isoprenylcysteine O-methyltransferase Ste14